MNDSWEGQLAPDDSLFSAAGGSLAALTATGPCLSTTATFPAVHIFSPDSRTDHGPGTPDPALHCNSLDGAVQGTGPALHAPVRVDKIRRMPAIGKDPVRAYLGAAPAVNAPVRIIPEGSFPVGVKHQAAPRNQRTPARRARAIPEPVMITIIGIYRNISVLTPVREVKGVQPVKLRAR